MNMVLSVLEVLLTQRAEGVVGFDCGVAINEFCTRYDTLWALGTSPGKFVGVK